MLNLNLCYTTPHPACTANRLSPQMAIITTETKLDIIKHVYNHKCWQQAEMIHEQIWRTMGYHTLEFKLMWRGARFTLVPAWRSITLEHTVSVSPGFTHIVINPQHNTHTHGFDKAVILFQLSLRLSYMYLSLAWFRAKEDVHVDHSCLF